MRRYTLNPSSLLLIVGTLLLAGAFATSLAQPLSAQQAPPATPQPLYALPDPRAYSTSSSSIALTKSGRLLVAANMLNNSVSVVQVQSSTLLAEVPVGKDPRSVAITPDDARALVVNRGDGTLWAIDLSTQQVVATYDVGVLPYGVVAAPDNTAYVSLQATSEVIRLDLDSGKVLNRIPVSASPAGLALWGDFLYVTHFWSGQFSLVYLPQMQVVRVLSTGADASLFQGVALDVSNGLAYLAESRSNAQNRALTFDTTIFPAVNVVDLEGLNVRRLSRITPDTADRPVNMPFAAALDSRRKVLYVVAAGSNSVTVIDLASGLATAHVEVGANPRGVVLNHDFSIAYVHNMLDGSISTIDMHTLKVTDTIPISDTKIPVNVIIGAQLFHSAADPRLSQSSWISCASCHFDGQSDGRDWVGISGGRNTPVLYDLKDTAPYNWDGQWQELADVELKIRSLMAGKGLIEGSISGAPGDIHAGMSIDLDSLTAYLLTLQGPPNPLTLDAQQVERGKAIFDAQKCATCHSGDLATDLQQHDVGTGGTFDTPSLRWLWASAPYLHDGSAVTLRDVFVLPGAHQLIRTLPGDDIDALVIYLLSR